MHLLLFFWLCDKPQVEAVIHKAMTQYCAAGVCSVSDNTCTDFLAFTGAAAGGGATACSVCDQQQCSHLHH